MKSKIVASAVFVSSMLLAQTAFAHVVVKPAEVGVGKFQSFSVGVPSEKPIATVGVRLLVPEGVNYVMPNVKPGWKIEVKKEKTGKEIEHDGMMMPEERVSEIVWTGGSVPAEQRDEFLFSLQVPTTTTTLIWKAYQTYQDGSIVSWDADPSVKKSEDENAAGPYSKTAIVDDLAAKPAAPAADAAKQNSTVPLSLSIVALALSVYSLVRSRKA